MDLIHTQSLYQPTRSLHTQPSEFGFRNPELTGKQLKKVYNLLTHGLKLFKLHTFFVCRCFSEQTAHTPFTLFTLSNETALAKLREQMKQMSSVQTERLAGKLARQILIQPARLIIHC